MRLDAECPGSRRSNRWTGRPDRWSGRPDRWTGRPDRWTGRPDRWTGQRNRPSEHRHGRTSAPIRSSAPARTEAGLDDPGAVTTLDRLGSIADYLVTRGPVIGDGDTIGSTPTAEIVAHHVPSTMDPAETVIRLSVGVGVGVDVDAGDRASQGRRGFLQRFRRR